MAWIITIMVGRAELVGRFMQQGIPFVLRTDIEVRQIVNKYTVMVVGSIAAVTGQSMAGP